MHYSVLSCQHKYTVSQKNCATFIHTFTLVLVLQGNVATKLSYSGKCFIRVMSHFFLIPTLKEF